MQKKYEESPVDSTIGKYPANCRVRMLAAYVFLNCICKYRKSLEILT